MRVRVKVQLSMKGIEGYTFVVTGGLGFVGAALCSELVRRGATEVRAFDLQPTSPWSSLLHSLGVKLIPGDICEKEDVGRAVQGAHCVFHLASFGMPGKEMLQCRRAEEVNVNGTSHVLEACVQFHIKRLVYLSTYNVVFGGKEIVNGDETLPYFPIDDHVDPFGRTKAIAEQLVLKSNNRPFEKKSGECLYTCAVRPAALYGPGEERRLPRIISLAKLGLLPFIVGEQGVKQDWIYVDNLVHALILASIALLDDTPKPPLAAGQAYFVSDGSPVNTFDFIRPLLKSLGYDLPKPSLTIKHALILGKVFEAVYTVLYPLLNQRWLPQPLILPADVYKVGVTHYFSTLKAREELGYVPVTSPEEGMAATISYWQKRERETVSEPTIYVWTFCVFGMIQLFCASFLPPVGPVRLLKAISLFIFRSMWTVRLVFMLAAAAHIGESVYAWQLAKRVDPENSTRWFWHTFALGFFSLRFLLKKAKQS